MKNLDIIKISNDDTKQTKNDKLIKQKALFVYVLNSVISNIKEQQNRKIIKNQYKNL